MVATAHAVRVDADPHEPDDFYRARCSCGWIAPHARGLLSAAQRDAVAHIGQLALPEVPPVLPLWGQR
jgi:hypothetical protein